MPRSDRHRSIYLCVLIKNPQVCDASLISGPEVQRCLRWRKETWDFPTVQTARRLKRVSDCALLSSRCLHCLPAAFTVLLFFLFSSYLQLFQSGLQSVWSAAQNMDLPVSGRAGLRPVFSPICCDSPGCSAVFVGVQPHDGDLTTCSSVFNMFKLFFSGSESHLRNSDQKHVNISKQ